MKTITVKPHYIFLTVISLLGVGLVYLTTSRYGIGVSNDAIFMLSAADNIAQGNGLFQYDGAPLIFWAPLFPALVGLLGKLSGFEILTVGLFVNAIAWGASLFLAGVLFRRTFPNNPIWFYAGSLLMLASVSGLSLAVNFATDPLFLVEFHLFLILAQIFLTSGKQKTMYALGVVTAIAMFTRYTGLVFALAGAILVLYHYWGDLRAMLRNVIKFAIVSGLPFAIWVALRNFPLTGTIVGKREFGTIIFAENFVYSYERMLRWFVPLFISSQIPMAAILVIAFVGIAAFIILKKRNIAEKISLPLLLPIVVVGVIYFVFVLATTFTLDHFLLHDDRYQMPLYALLLILIFMAVQHLFLANLDNNQRKKAQILIILVILIWSVYPSWAVYKFVRNSREQGVVHYNMFNTKSYRDSTFIQQLSVYEFEPGRQLFSNEAGIVYYFTRLPVKASFNEPGKEFEKFPIALYLLDHYQEWFDGGEAYLIWLLPNQKRNYYYPGLLELVYDLEVEFKFKHGVVYRLRSQGE